MKSSQLARRLHRERLVIASVYPAALPNIERPFDGLTVYSIAPCPKGEPAQLLTLEDAVQYAQDPLSRDITTETLIHVEEIADDLIKHWARTPIGAPPGSGPGVGLIAGETPRPDELAALYARQDLMFEYFYQDGLRLAQNQEWRGINHNHRLAARWLEREEPWAIEMSKAPVAALEECPMCGGMIPGGKTFCMHCKQQIREKPAEFLFEPAKRKAA